MKLLQFLHQHSSAASAAEESLLVRLKKGDPKAVAAWHREYSVRLRRLVAGKISIVADVEEVTQDTFLSCLKELPLFRGESSLWTWMCRVAQHEIADYYRKHYAKKVIRALPLADYIPWGELYDAQGVSHHVQHALKQLSHESQELLQQKYVDRKKVLQIAIETGRTVKAVESLLFRARGEFREAYRQATEGSGA